MDRLFKLQMACTKLAEGNNLGKTQNPFEEQRRPFSSARGLFHCLRLTDCHKEVESSSVAIFFTPDKAPPLVNVVFNFKRGIFISILANKHQFWCARCSQAFCAISARGETETKTFFLSTSVKSVRGFLPGRKIIETISADKSLFPVQSKYWCVWPCPRVQGGGLVVTNWSQFTTSALEIGPIHFPYRTTETPRLNL